MLPVENRVFLDTNVLVAAIKDEDFFKEKATMLLESLEMGKARGFCSVVSLSECAFVLKKIGRQKEIPTVIRSLLALEGLEFLPLTSETFSRAASLMDAHRLTLSDALIISTMVDNGFQEIISGDEYFDKIKFITRKPL